MGRWTLIDISFMDEEWWKKSSIYVRYIYIFFLTSPLSNIAGVYAIDITDICDYTHLSKKTVKEIMAALEIIQKIIYYKGYIIIPGYTSMKDWETKPSIKKKIDADLKNLPPMILLKLKESNYEYPHIPEIENEEQLMARMQKEEIPQINTDKKLTLNIKGEGSITFPFPYPEKNRPGVLEDE